MMLPGQVGHGPLAVLKGPTPKLVSLLVMLYTPAEESGYLPYAPMLQSLSLTHTGMSCSPFATYPALTYASITPCRSGPPSHSISGFLSRARQTLEKIKISAVVEHSARASEPLLLPQLRTLVLEHSFAPPSPNTIPAVTLLVTPRLTHLHLGMFCDILPALTISFLEAVSSTVRTLKLFRPLTADGLERLRHLQNVEEVEFGVSVDEGVYTALISDVPPIWPRLSVMDMRRPSKAAGDALIKLVASRNLSHAQGGASSEPPRPCRLREVILSPDAPRWVSAEVQRLLAL